MLVEGNAYRLLTRTSEIFLIFPPIDFRNRINAYLTLQKVIMSHKILISRKGKTDVRRELAIQDSSS